MRTQTLSGETAVDPVCGMTVDIGEARSRDLTSHLDGTTYFFCSKGCKLDFEEEPTRYLDAATSRACKRRLIRAGPGSTLERSSAKPPRVTST